MGGTGLVFRPPVLDKIDFYNHIEGFCLCLMPFFFL